MQAMSDPRKAETTPAKSLIYELVAGYFKSHARKSRKSLQETETQLENMRRIFMESRDQTLEQQEASKAKQFISSLSRKDYRELARQRLLQAGEKIHGSDSDSGEPNG